ncbi:MAG: hemin uptake protein HemP [Burkholderiaceae bacterium]|jgi:hemin uptake protein HemP|nr:MAG: hemin uptake protein HemP [Burkholderiaceae bacterium]
MAQPPGEPTTEAPDQDGTVRDPAEPPRDAPIPSSTLLQGRCCLEISHNGMVYRLHVTRMGKLILTK